MAPRCITKFCWDKNEAGYDKSLEELPFPSCFWEGHSNEDGQFNIIKEGLKKMVTTAQSWESKPQVILVTPPPVLDCCAYDIWKGLVQKAI